ncbi:putative protein kinase RLK-Pelle-CR4L family [Helianthus debilis subsp. tardiflorus]
MYRAKLDHYDKGSHSSKRHNTVLIKRYPFGDDYYTEMDFFTEIEILTSGVKHPNIVTLLGFCIEAFETILVVDNISNGFLGDYLKNINNKRILTWEKRLKICIDVAHALNYIHSELDDQKMLIQRDICSYNIGLDENLGAKIVHFWRSVFMRPNHEDQALNLEFVGRQNYIDPEYMKTYKVKRESDVYGFGVVMFELLFGRLANDPIYKKESENGLVFVARQSFYTGTLEEMIDPIIKLLFGRLANDPIYKKESENGLVFVARQSFYTGTLEEMIDPIIKEEMRDNSFVLNRGLNKDSLHTFIAIAHQCVVKTQDKRPTMKAVVNELEKALFFQVSHSSNFILSMPRSNLCDDLL